MIIDVLITLDDSQMPPVIPSMLEEVIEKSLALKIASGDFFDSNFDLPVLQVGHYKIESGMIRRVNG